jgi:hypothetical protein
LEKLWTGARQQCAAIVFEEESEKHNMKTNILRNTVNGARPCLLIMCGGIVERVHRENKNVRGGILNFENAA